MSPYWSSANSKDLMGPGRWYSQPPGGSSFNGPGDIAGMVVWIDFSDTATLSPAAITDGTAITQAADKSGNNKHFTQGTGARQPLWKAGIQNSLGAAKFDGSNDWMESNLGSNYSTFTTFVVARSITNRRFNAAVTGTVGTTGSLTIEVGANANSIDIWDYNVTSSGDAVTPANSFPINTGMLITHSYTSGAGSLYLNNSLQGTHTRTGAFQMGSNMAIGLDATVGGFFGWNGYLMELVMYNSILASSDRTNVSNFLINKWGL